MLVCAAIRTPSNDRFLMGSFRQAVECLILVNLLQRLIDATCEKGLFRTLGHLQVLRLNFLFMALVVERSCRADNDVSNSGLQVYEPFGLFVIDTNDDVLFHLTQVVGDNVICVKED